MGGYRLPERTARIKFEDTAYDGAEVVVSLNVKIGVYRQIIAPRETDSSLDASIALLCGFIREWNLEDEEGPIPVSVEGFDRIDDVGFLTALMNGWAAAMGGESTVSAPLDQGSSSGATSTDATPSESPTG